MKVVKPASIIAGALLLAACIGGLPRSLRKDIAYEHDKLRDAQWQVGRSQNAVNQDVAKNSDLFASTSLAAEWNTKFQVVREKLKSAEDADKQLAEFSRRNRADSRDRVERLLATERNLRRSALEDSQAVEAAATKWVGFKDNLASNLDKMKREYDAVHSVDLQPVAATVQKAEHDWPAKKDALETRLAAVRAIPNEAETEWSSTEAARRDASAGKISGPELATLIQADDVLSRDASSVGVKVDELRASCGQLYDSWDKILTDLDISRDAGDRLYRERIKTVSTHIIDVDSKKSETTSDEHWVDVSEPAFHAVENDLGMAIAHKDAGLFDSEAQTTPQPAGFAYIAPESQGSNQYGYWTHSGGQTFWTFLPQYLILRELLWNHDYRPVVLDEYKGYRTAQRSGHTYYGQETPWSPPKYGSHGTFTQTHYAQSRYVQSGGFKGSAYASHNGSSFGRSQGEQRGGSALSQNGAGHRFGSKSGSPSGHRFGRMRSPGRAFGRRR